MADPLERLKTALADRYAIERELGRGGMATVLAVLLIGIPCSASAQAASADMSIARNKYPPSPSVRVTRNLHYATNGDHRMLLDLYLPPGSSAALLPVVIVVRGNGWFNGDKEAFGFIASRLAEAGIAAASIEYRTSAEAKFPGAVHDLKAAVRWLRANGAKHGVDPARIGAIGGSAGGHLVALLGTSLDESSLEGSGGTPGVSSAISAVVAMAPTTDLRKTWADYLGKRDSASAIPAFLGPGLSSADPRLVTSSPVTYVSARSPALLLIHSHADDVVPFEQSLLLKARYEAFSRPVQLITLEKAAHAFWNQSEYFPEVMDSASSFFRRILR